MNKVAKKVALGCWFSPINARILCSCAGGGSRGFNTKDADEHQIFHDKVNSSFKLDSDRSLLPAQLCRTMAGNLKSGMMSRFSPISERFSLSDYPQAASKLPIRLVPGVKQFCSGTNIPTSFNMNLVEDQIKFYNEQRVLLPRDPQGIGYWRYLVSPEKLPEDLYTEISDTSQARKCLLVTEASFLPKKISFFEPAFLRVIAPSEILEFTSWALKTSRISTTQHLSASTIL